MIYHDQRTNHERGHSPAPRPSPMPRGEGERQLILWHIERRAAEHDREAHAHIGGDGEKVSEYQHRGEACEALAEEIRTGQHTDARPLGDLRGRAGRMGTPAVEFISNLDRLTVALVPGAKIQIDQHPLDAHDDCSLVAWRMPTPAVGPVSYLFRLIVTRSGEASALEEAKRLACLLYWNWWHTESPEAVAMWGES